MQQKTSLLQLRTWHCNHQQPPNLAEGQEHGRKPLCDTNVQGLLKGYDLAKTLRKTSRTVYLNQKSNAACYEEEQEGNNATRKTLGQLKSSLDWMEPPY
jgi:hypothetical protein